MSMESVNDRGIVLLGCGKMGGALLQGWLAGGISPGAVWVVDPTAEPSVPDVHWNDPLPASPAVVVVAVKPQLVAEALPQVAAFAGGGTAFLSVAAGTTLATFASHLGETTPIIRSIPNTPAAIGKGITALIPNAAAAGLVDLARALLGAVGRTVLLDGEEQMDAVTAVSGSGPAYVFHMIEALAAAGEAEGLPPAMALTLAEATVAGAGALAESADDGPAQLRRNVTSPNGTTEAGLKPLMHPETGLVPLFRSAVRAAAYRSRELGA